MEALRNSLIHLASHLRLFLEKCLSFDRTVDEEQESFFWRMLGVPVDWLEGYCEVAAWWDGKVLHVRASLKDVEDALERVTSVLLHAMRWRKFFRFPVYDSER